MDPERKRALKKLGKAEVTRRSAELQAALSTANPASMGSDEWMLNHTLGAQRERWLRRSLPLLHAKRLHALFVVRPYEGDGYRLALFLRLDEIGRARSRSSRSGVADRAG